MLSDTNAACVAFTLALCLEKGGEPTLDQREVQKKTTTHTWKSHEILEDKWAKWLQHFLPAMVHYLMGYPRLLPLLSLKEVLMGEKRLSIMLRCLATGNIFEYFKFVRVTSRSTAVIVLETFLLLGRRTVTEWILCNALHRRFKILHNILCQTSFDWHNIFCHPSVLPLDD